MLKQVELSRTDAFCFAVKKALEKQRAIIDECEIRSVQITIALNRNGQANVTVSHRTEDVIMGCYDGYSRNDGYIFNST